MQDNKYNGWTNWETWLINLHYEQDIADIKANNLELDAYDMALLMKETITDAALDNIEQGAGSFIVDLVSGALSLVDWREINTNCEIDAVQA